MIELDTFGSLDSGGTDVNNQGLVVGLSYDFGEPRQFQPRRSFAYAWQGGVSIGLATSESGWASARGVNDLGQIVGRTIGSTGEPVAFLWELRPN